MHAGVGEFEIGNGRGGGLAAFQCDVQAADEQPVLDGIEPLGAFRVAGAHLVPPTFLVGEISGGLSHGGFTVWFAACKPIQESNCC